MIWFDLQSGGIYLRHPMARSHRMQFANRLYWNVKILIRKVGYSPLKLFIEFSGESPGMDFEYHALAGTRR